MKTDKFGENITYISDGESHENDIAGFVKKKGFHGFSPEGITSYLTYRHPVGGLTMFEGYEKIPFGYGQNFRMYMNYDYRESFFKYFLDNYRYFSLDDRKIIRPEYLTDDFELTMKYIEASELDFDIRNWALYFTQKLHTPGLITRGANAMRFNGLPLGFPFIYGPLVDYTNSLPFEYKVAWKSDNDAVKARDMNFRDVSEIHDILKYIIKKGAESYLNHKIIYRQKKGFPVPFQQWLKDLKEWDLDRDIFLSKNISGYTGWKNLC